MGREKNEKHKGRRMLTRWQVYQFVTSNKIKRKSECQFYINFVCT